MAVADAIPQLRAALAGRYAIERELGSGGWATVYLAHDHKHDRKVALKVLRSDVARTLGSGRFLREISIAGRLIHPHILPLYDSGEAGDSLYYVMPFIVMPFIEGETLRQRLLREHQLPLSDTLTVARQVADALTFAHAQSLVQEEPPEPVQRLLGTLPQPSPASQPVRLSWKTPEAKGRRRPIPIPGTVEQRCQAARPGAALGTVIPVVSMTVKNRACGDDP